MVVNEANPYEILLASFSDRFLHNLRILRFELRYLKSHKYLYQSMAKNLRSSLLDFIIVRYLSIRSNEDGEDGFKKFKENVDSLLCDHLKNGVGYLKNLKDSGWINKDEYIKGLKNLKSDYPMGFIEGEVDTDNPEKSLITKDYLSPKGMFKRVPMKNDYRDFAVAYEIYLHFSRYDHFGTFSPILSNEAIRDRHLIPTILFMIRGAILSLQLINDGYKGLASYNNLVRLELKMKNLKYERN